LLTLQDEDDWELIVVNPKKVDNEEDEKPIAK